MKPTVRRRFGGLFLSSEALLESFIQYARKIKFLLAETFGLRSKTDSEEDFYFGGSYFAAQIIPPPRLIESLFRGKREIKFLLNDDNYFISMRNMWADFRNNMASRKNFDLRKLPQLHERLVENASLAVSDYDIVAINAPWLGEAVKKKLAIPLDEHIKSAGLSSLVPRWYLACSVQVVTSHTRNTSSLSLPETSRLPSGENCRHVTLPVCPASRPASLPVAVSQR